MRIVVQRVAEAGVTIDGREVAAIGQGLLILLGIEDADTQDDIDWLCRKTTNLRIFNDEMGLMNRSIQDVGGSFLVVSQFTLYGSTKKGNRPSFIRSSKPDFAIPVYEAFIRALQQTSGLPVSTGQFGAEMQVRLVNDGPVTIIIDTKIKE